MGEDLMSSNLNIHNYKQFLKYIVCCHFRGSSEIFTDNYARFLLQK